MIGSDSEEDLERIARGAFWLMWLAVARQELKLDEAKVRAFLGDVASGDVLVPENEKPLDGDEWSGGPGIAQQQLQDAAQYVIRGNGAAVLQESKGYQPDITTKDEILTVHFPAVPCPYVDAYIACVLASLDTPNEVSDEPSESQ